MAKSEKKEKKRKERSDEAGDTTVGDASMTVSDVLQERPAKKSKKDKNEVVIDVKELSPIARPLAERKLIKKLHKVIKKASKQRQVKRGVKEVVKGIRKGEKGLLVLAADITPMDIISHLPILAEDEKVPYVFIPSKEELGHASATKRPTSCVMVCPNLKKRKRAANKEEKKEGEDEEKDEDYREHYDECCKEVAKLQEKIIY